MLGKAALIITALAATPMLVPAVGEDAEVCRPYAAKLTQEIVNALWKRAYAVCMNSETPPPLPDGWEMSIAKIVQQPEMTEVDEAHTQEITEPKLSPNELDKIGTKPATGRIKAKKVKTVPVLPDENKVASLPEPVAADKPAKPVKTGRSGFAKGTAEWNAYCKKYWPASWDAKTGTVIKSRHKRIPCPA